MEDKHDNLTPALLDLRKCRDNIAGFLSKCAEMPDEIIRHCDRNGWNSSVAYDIQHAMFELGHCLATLVKWDDELDLTEEQLRRINGISLRGM